MDNYIIHGIVTLTDEKNYLRNILEAAEETGEDLEKIIQDRIEAIYAQLEELEGGECEQPDPDAG